MDRTINATQTLINDSELVSKSYTLEAGVAEALISIAKSDGRSASNYLNRLLKNHIQEVRQNQQQGVAA